jgi:hypothetical protein
MSSIKKGGETPDPNIIVICISGGGDFDYIKTWCDVATKVGSRVFM